VWHDKIRLFITDSNKKKQIEGDVLVVQMRGNG
jgi:hypothetical protein